MFQRWQRLSRCGVLQHVALKDANCDMHICCQHTCRVGKMSWASGHPLGMLSSHRQLYEVLAAKGVAGRRLPVLLVANKADQGAKAHTPDFVRRRLEREL